MNQMMPFLSIFYPWETAPSLDLSTYAPPNYQELLLTFILRKIADLIYFEVRKSERSPLSLDSTQLPGRLFSPSDISKKLSHHFLLHFPIGMGSYDHHTKYQGVIP